MVTVKIRPVGAGLLQMRRCVWAEQRLAQEFDLHRADTGFVQCRKFCAVVNGLERACVRTVQGDGADACVRIEAETLRPAIGNAPHFAGADRQRIGPGFATLIALVAEIDELRQAVGRGTFDQDGAIGALAYTVPYAIATILLTICGPIVVAIMYVLRS